MTDIPGYGSIWITRSIEAHFNQTPGQRFILTCGVPEPPSWDYEPFQVHILGSYQAPGLRLIIKRRLFSHHVPEPPSWQNYTCWLGGPANPATKDILPNLTCRDLIIYANCSQMQGIQDYSQMSVSMRTFGSTHHKATLLRAVIHLSGSDCVFHAYRDTW